MSLCNDCKHRRSCDDTSHSVEGCGDYQQITDPRDREIAVLRAQVKRLPCGHAAFSLFSEMYKGAKPYCTVCALHQEIKDNETEIEILRAQVRVLVQWACCPRTAGLAVDCPEGGECDCYACTERVSRQQAEKEVDDASKA